jgi:Alkylmercury lyase
MLGQPADVRSTCPVTGSHIRLTVDPNGVRQADPQAALGLLPARGHDLDGRHHRHLLLPRALPRNARGCRALACRHPEGTVLDLDDTYELGRKANRCCTG